MSKPNTRPRARTAAELKEGAAYVAYELNVMLWAAQTVQTTQDWRLKGVGVEAVLLHARALCDLPLSPGSGKGR